MASVATSDSLMPVISLSIDGRLSGCPVSACLICSTGSKSGPNREPCIQDHIGIGIAEFHHSSKCRAADGTCLVSCSGALLSRNLLLHTRRSDTPRAPRHQPACRLWQRSTARALPSGSGAASHRRPAACLPTGPRALNSPLQTEASAAVRCRVQSALVCSPAYPHPPVMVRCVWMTHRYGLISRLGCERRARSSRRIMKTPPVLDRLICWSNKEPILTVSPRRRV